MNRAEFEQLLLENEELRTALAQLRERAAELQGYEQRVARVRSLIHASIYDFVKAGMPKAALARQVGLSRQRINSIIHEQEAKGRRKAKSSVSDLMDALAAASSKTPSKHAHTKRTARTHTKKAIKRKAGV